MIQKSNIEIYQEPEIFSKAKFSPFSHGYCSHAFVSIVQYAECSLADFSVGALTSSICSSCCLLQFRGAGTGSSSFCGTGALSAEVLIQLPFFSASALCRRKTGSFCSEQMEWIMKIQQSLYRMVVSFFFFFLMLHSMMRFKYILAL